MNKIIAVTLAAAAMSTMAGPAHAGKAAPKPDKAARVAIVTTPDSLVPMGTSVNVEVTYSCKNTSRTTHYLSGDVSQPDTPHHVIGYRGDLGGILAATCTGKPVTQRLGFQRSAYWDFSPNPTLATGPAQLTFNVEARGTFGSGAGWYDIVGPGASVTKTVDIPYVY